MEALIRELPPGAVLVDLRQESHGFLDGRPVSWFAQGNAANLGLETRQVLADEAARLDALARAGRVTVVVPRAKDDQGRLARWERLDVAVRGVESEAGLARRLGLRYARIPVRDHARPSDGAADAFLELWRKLPRPAWLHLHCHAGEGRTGTFLAMAAMLADSGRAPLEEVLARQAALAGTPPRKPRGYKIALALEREEFLRRFHAFASAGSPQSWSAWAAGGGR